MTEYEVLRQDINPCGGARNAITKLFDVETDDPVAYVRENGPFPITDTGRNEDGDLVITTADGKGNVVRYIFMA